MAKEIDIGDVVEAFSNDIWYIGILEDIHENLKEPYSVRLLSNQRLYGFSKIRLLEKANYE